MRKETHVADAPSFCGAGTATGGSPRRAVIGTSSRGLIRTRATTYVLKAAVWVLSIRPDLTTGGGRAATMLRITSHIRLPGCAASRTTKYVWKQGM